MTETVEAKRVKSSALPWFITSRVRAVKRQGLSEVEQACLALEAEGMPCPMHIDPEQWVRMNFSFICSKYYEKYPQGSAEASKNKAARKKRKKQRLVERRPSTPKPKTVSGIDVTLDAFLSTFEWRRVRMEALKKYGPRCMC
jgi:hypothetical protein